MANPFTCTLLSIADDGTNTYCTFQVSSGTTTMPPFQAVFPSAPTITVVKAYMQAIANNQPTVNAALATLLNVPTQGQ